MTCPVIADKVDFQRHLNGCERLINDLSKSIQAIEKFAQKLLINRTASEQETYFDELNNITSQLEHLYSSMSTLDQSSYAVNSRKRLDVIKCNLEKTRIKFEQIQQYARIAFGYHYEPNQFESISSEQQEQLMKLIEKSPYDEQMELNLINQRTITVSTLEDDLTDLRETFIDIGNIIHQQGTTINAIEQSLTVADEMVYSAKEEIKTTVNNKKRSNRIKWILLAIVIITCLLLIIIIYFSLKLASPFRAK
ncbi:unnamed protein product [Adineta ricciae]|uniref:t-SNARE coiled-coil homology domain-containing protein n=1 Tax=Adineta ricciae TaxID=249248 RepID=A0A815PNY2_ADIRI|nr:unnamed protein product [Adineta ricciae]CAF1451863.1 unnamed protein product [Adineta ricciae]